MDDLFTLFGPAFGARVLAVEWRLCTWQPDSFLLAFFGWHLPWSLIQFLVHACTASSRLAHCHCVSERPSLHLEPTSSRWVPHTANQHKGHCDSTRFLLGNRGCLPFPTWDRGCSSVVSSLPCPPSSQEEVG